MMNFDWNSYASFELAFAAYEEYQQRCHWDRFLPALNAYATVATFQFREISSSFLCRQPVHSHVAPPENDFSQQALRRDLGGAVRRYSLGQQAKGVSITPQMAGCLSMEEHYERACGLKHPIRLVSATLPPVWKHVFSQLNSGLNKWGGLALTRLVSYRARVMAWMRDLATQLEPLRCRMRDAMPPSARIVSGHVHTPLLYVLLKATGYSNPSFATSFLIGAPLVGEFFSAALPARDIPGGEFSLWKIKAIAAKCRAKQSQVTATLSPEAAKKSMDKMTKEFASKTLVGPFRTRELLRLAIQREIRSHQGLSNFCLDDEMLVVSTQFSVEESHAYAEAATPSQDAESTFAFKVRNIFNGKKLNGLSKAYSTYIPCTHADVSVIVMQWLESWQRLHVEDQTLLGWPSDFSAAYRQMPLSALHLMFSGVCYFDYGQKQQRFAYYRALPFGSSLAPAEWSETVVALCHIAAIALLMVITHCVDDVSNIELKATVDSARSAFLELCKLLGLVLDPDKSLMPSHDFVYLGLRMILPATLLGRKFSLMIPEPRRIRLRFQLTSILQEAKLTPASASSMRGRLYFYAYWLPEARAYLVFFSKRQYAEDDPTHTWLLTPELIDTIAFFLELLDNEIFLAGIRPESFYNRKQAVIYTDGSLTDLDRGIGGVCQCEGAPEPTYFAEELEDGIFYPHIAVVEMRAVLFALRYFSNDIKKHAVLFFIDNTHALGCLLRRSAPLRPETLDERRKSLLRISERSHKDFELLSEDIKYSMNELARQIWALITELDVLIWFEYVNTKLNIADPPSRGFVPPCGGARVGNIDWCMRPYSEFIATEKEPEV